MDEDFDSILEQCLSQVGAGKARVQSCLLSYPSRADDLEPLLRTAEWFRTVPAPELPPDVNARIEARVFRATRPRRRLPGWKLPSIRLDRRWALAGLGAIVVIALVVAIASAAAPGVLPGSPVYPVKLAAEQAWLWVTPAGAKAEVRLHIAQRRLEELQALAARGAFDPAVAQAMTDQMNAALDAIPGLPSSVSLPIVQEADGLAHQQEQVLMGLLASQPMTSRQTVQDALQASAAQAERTHEMLELLGGDEEPLAPSETPVPPRELGGNAEEQTATPQPLGLTKTPQPPGLTKTPQPPAQSNPVELEGKSKPETPPGQIKKEEAPGQIKKEEAPGQEKKESGSESRPAPEAKPTKGAKE
jgi:hypothetical protein